MGFQYTPEQVADISDVVLECMKDGLSLRKACIEAGISASGFLKWVDADHELRERYACAREALIDKIADETIDISDAPVGTTDNGSTDSGAVAKQRLQVDTRKWLLSKLAPKKYGDKLDIDMNASLTTMTEEQRLARIAELHAKMFV